MPGYGDVAPYGDLDYKQDAVESFAIENKINAVTGRCLRLAIKEDQGQGYSIYKNATVPEAWIWPEPQSVPITVYDNNNHARHLVLDERKGKWYEIGTRNGPANSNLVASYLDKADNYGGTEIPCEVHFKEDIAKNEHQKVEHIENHQYIRPQAKENVGDSNYDSNGLRPAFEGEIDIYKDGVLVANSKTKDIPYGGDFVFDKRVQGNRLRIGLKTTASEFRLTGNDRYYLQIDKNATRKEMTEVSWQDELQVDLKVWLTRGVNPMLNRATGDTVDGGYDSVVEGPDGIDNSAVQFTPTNGFETEIDGTGNYTFIFSLSNIATPFAVTDQISITEAGGVYSVVVTNGVDTITQELEWDGSGWATIAVKRDSEFIYISENGGASNAELITTIEDISGTLNICNGQDGDMYDFRYYEKVITDGALDYYYNNREVLLPPW